MTDVYYFRSEEEHELYIYGHAGYDSEGKDIVCSAVSSLGWALIGFLENNANDTSEYAHLTDSGKLAVCACSSPAVDAAYSMAVIGLRQIAKKYPDYVRFHTLPRSFEADDLGERPCMTCGKGHEKGA